MPDDAKPEQVLFPVEVTVNGVRVTVTLMLKPYGECRGIKDHDQRTAAARDDLTIKRFPFLTLWRKDRTRNTW